jgi:hypothetical protein
MFVALCLILFSAAIHAVVNILTKRADNKYAMRLLICIFSAIIVTPALFFVPLPQGKGSSSAPPASTPSVNCFW